jgi:hypothetical protein
MKKDPSFLDSPSWHDAMRVPATRTPLDDYVREQHIFLSKCIADLTRLMMDLRAFLRCQSLTPYVASSETSLLIDRFKILRAETRAEIRSETKAELSYERDGALCATTFILALLLALLDTTLLELLSGIPEGAKNNSTLWDILQGEIEECLDLALYNYIGAFKGKPFSKKRLAFTCRVLYDYMAKSGNTQCVGYWNRLNKNLKSMNEDPMFGETL